MKKLAIVAFLLFLFDAGAVANPYLPSAGARPTTLRVATSAVTGGFVHFYARLDYGIFEKYGLKCEHIYIRGQSPALAALAGDQLQFTYGAADGSLPGLAAGVEAKVVASPLVKLPYVMVARKEIRRPEDLKGKSIGVTRPGDLSARLSRQVVRKFGLTTDEVTIHPIGGSQSERYQAMVANVVQAILVTPPLDVRAKHDGFNVIYRLVDLEIPFIYSSLLTNYKMLRERPETVQRMVAALAETVHFVEKNPDKAKAAIAKAMRVKDEEALQSSYNVYAKEIVDRTMVVPGKSVSEAVDIARETGTLVRRKPEELYDNSFVNNLEKSGFLKEIWGNENYRR
ncbi:MAG TPA: ABC transporter substrate-binding protein [Candidatus Binatia bacterium]|jgi:NitT/TauT family transport system substrate-binding protein|nr:ABC transporter substrate-binding protein [Candidatus Binatia bacterium]